MRLLNLAVLGASVALIAAPAYAQHSNQGSSSGMSTQSQSAEQGNGNSREALRQSLEKAGFTHVRIEPEVFVVHALNSQGEPVLMRIGPDSMEAVTALGASQSNSNGSGMSGSGNESGMNRSGMNSSGMGTPGNGNGGTAR